MESLRYARNGNPYLTMLLFLMLGSGVLFLFTTGLYVARWGDPSWADFKLPVVFWVSTALMAISSYTLYQANQCRKAESYDELKTWLGITLLLGLGFAVGQVVGWVQMVQAGIVASNLAGAFIYLLSGLHAAHVLGALWLMARVYNQAYKSESYVDAYIVQQLNPVAQTYFKLAMYFWHFVDVLWLVLFAVFLIKHF